jgi:hypothetical protein
MAPWIGALGAFVSGSNTTSNLLFGMLQRRTAEVLGLGVAWILAAQTAGGAIGSVLSPTKISVGAASARGAPRSEAEGPAAASESAPCAACCDTPLPAAGAGGIVGLVMLRRRMSGSTAISAGPRRRSWYPSSWSPRLETLALTGGAPAAGEVLLMVIAAAMLAGAILG